MRKLALALFFVPLLGGCHGDAEVRAQTPETKAQVQQQIDQVNNNAQIPPAAKQNILAGLQAKLKGAK